ncbi:MAG TPA: carbohydrate porin [Caulobacteraceae bacterium]
MKLRHICHALASVAFGLLVPCWAIADDTTPQDFAVHGQATFIYQGYPPFAAPYSGANSLPPGGQARETADVTLLVGVRPWAGGEIWLDPEFDQGFGLHDTLGVAGFTNGEGAKVGRVRPYFRLPRLFLRQTVNLGGDVSKVDPDLNQLGGSQSANRIVVTVGKFNVTDVFDTNAYAHDPKQDFLNWALIDAGTFDYAADAWGYTVGASVEWYHGPWTVRAGVFDLSKMPNGEKLDPNLGQFQLVGEVERHYSILGKDGSIKVTGFLSRGRMGLYSDAIELGAELGEPPNTALVRRYRSRPGISVNLQQKITDDLGAFTRAGWDRSDVEAYEYADIDQTVSAGLSMAGKRWGRSDDTIGLAGVINNISKEHQAYLAAGGLGILVGDGRLPHPRTENILETYYKAALTRFLQLTLDYQFVDNPAYNTDRGPVSIFAIRLHAQF